jgi:hypothetical protein
VTVVFSTLSPWGSALLLAAGEVYDCDASGNRQQPVTVEIVLSKQWKDRLPEIKTALQGGDATMKIRPRIFPFLDPPANIGIGKCVPAEQARRAMEVAIRTYGKLDRLIRQDILPHHWVKIGSTDIAELAWTPVSPEDLTRLTDPALTSAPFHALYRQLAAPKERRLPFGMGIEKIEEETLTEPIEILSHEWHPDAVWERNRKTKYNWKATNRNNSDAKKRVYVYYDLLDAGGVPVARNVANQFIEPHQTIDVSSDSYIESVDLPRVTGSRAIAKTGS